MAIKILYIEDDPQSIRLVQRMLSHLDYEITHVSTGLAGIEAAKSMHPDLILADIRLPDMSGVEMVHRIRQDVGNDDIPIVALTANNMSGDKETYIEAGCTGYLAKPILRVELCTMISHLLEETDRANLATVGYSSTYNSQNHDTLSISDKKDGAAR